MYYLSDPLSGEIWWQKAQIEGEDPKNPDTLIVLISDEHGLLMKKTKIPRRLFAEQFVADPLEPGLYLSKVQVQDVEEKSVLFIRLNANGQEDAFNGSLGVRRLDKGIFRETYFHPAHQPHLNST